MVGFRKPQNSFTKKFVSFTKKFVSFTKNREDFIIFYFNFIGQNYYKIDHLTY